MNETVRQYQVELIDENNSKTTVLSTSLTDAQRKIHQLVGNNSRLSEKGESSTRAILLGAEVVGSITEMELPYVLSLQNWFDNRQRETRQPAQKVA